MKRVGGRSPKWTVTRLMLPSGAGPATRNLKGEVRGGREKDGGTEGREAEDGDEPEDLEDQRGKRRRDQFE